MVFSAFEFLKSAFTDGFSSYTKSLNERMQNKPNVIHEIPQRYSDTEENFAQPSDGEEQEKKNEDQPKQDQLKADQEQEKKDKDQPKQYQDQQGKDQDQSGDEFSEQMFREKMENVCREEYEKPIESDYGRQLQSKDPKDLYDNYNPGPSKPDGSVNFECHCVGHLVASPCGHYFRQALKCQKAATEENLMQGECADEFAAFVRCSLETRCFRTVHDDEDEKKNEANETAKDKN